MPPWPLYSCAHYASLEVPDAIWRLTKVNWLSHFANMIVQCLFHGKALWWVLICDTNIFILCTYSHTHAQASLLDSLSPIIWSSLSRTPTQVAWLSITFSMESGWPGYCPKLCPLRRFFKAIIVRGYVATTHIYSHMDIYIFINWVQVFSSIRRWYGHQCRLREGPGSIVVVMGIWVTNSTHA